VSPEEVKSALTEIKSWLARYELNYERWKTPTELGEKTRKKDLPFLCEQAVCTLKKITKKSKGLPASLKIDYSKELSKWEKRNLISKTPLLFDTSLHPSSSERKSAEVSSTLEIPRRGFIRSQSQ